jgi:hypothetical protein
MKVLIDTDLMKFARVFAYCKFLTNGLNEKAIPTFDAFDSTNPDLVVIKEANLTKAAIKCIAERPELRVVIFADDSDSSKFLKQAVGDSFLYLKDYDNFVDVITYSNGTYIPELECDFVSTEKLDGVEINEPYTLRIFNQEVVNSPHYCGYVNEFKVKDIFRSAKAVVTKNNRMDVIVSGGNPVDSICPACLQNRPDHSAERANILNNSTSFHLVASILESIGYNQEKNVVLNRLGDFK